MDEETVVVGGIGDDDGEMIDGARIFDTASTGVAGPRRRPDWSWAKEASAFAGPAGRFFSDGKWLYSSTTAGLSKWDLKSGARVGHIENFHPTHHHSSAGQLVQVVDDVLLHWSTR